MRTARTGLCTLEDPAAQKGMEVSLVRALVGALSTGGYCQIPLKTRNASCESLLRRSADFLTQQLGKPVYIQDLCAAVGVSERSLQACFQSYLGVSPMRYLRLRRLQQTRRALREFSRDQTSVKSIALDYGFCDLGRFSVHYRQLFGETPFTTLCERTRTQGGQVRSGALGCSSLS